MAESVAANIIYPNNCPNFDGKVVVQFVVTKTGDIGEVKVSRSVDPVLDSIAIAAVKQLPRFIPGQQDGKPTKVWYTLPFSFKQPKMSQSEEADYWFNLGYSYLYGKNGHLIDKIEARRCLKRASDLGHPYADTLLKEAMR